ncbi:hypothetical protein ABVT39_011201 [Epinephelus coioides]
MAEDEGAAEQTDNEEEMQVEEERDPLPGGSRTRSQQDNEEQESCKQCRHQ